MSDNPAIANEGIDRGATAHVLVVHAGDGQRSAVALALRDAGFVVTEMGRGATPLSPAEANALDAIIVDEPTVDTDELQSIVGAIVRIRRQERERFEAAAIAETAALSAAATALAKANEDRRRLETERGRLAAIFHEAPSFLAVLRGPDHVFERVNPAYFQLVGNRDPVGQALLDALPEVRGQGFVEIIDRVRETGVPFLGRRLPVHLSRTPGAPQELRYVDMVYQRLVDADGDFLIVSHGVDVTEQVLATKALEEVQSQLRAQFEKLPVPTYLWEQAGDDFILVDCNEVAMQLFADPAAAIGRRGADLFPDGQPIAEYGMQCLRENAVVRRTVEYESEGSQGRRRFDLVFGPQQPNRVLVHSFDTTERAVLEGQLRQAQKMDAVGRLAGGVAHDFNNILTVIGAHSAFLLESLGAADPQREDAEEIHKATTRAAGLTRQLLAFSRKQMLKPQLLEINGLILEAEKMLRRLLGADIAISTVLAPDLGRVIADPTQVEQVILNLAVNARDAMPRGGSLTIITRNVTIAGGASRAGVMVPEGEYVLLEVSDTGVGMDATVQARLFEPFFTTKEKGQGTGLGLATVYGIVKQSAGYILLNSEPDHGSTFSIYLPRVPAGDGAEERRAAEGASVHGVETVLLVEDEHAVRAIARRILRRQGYVVLEAANGAEALAISDKFTMPIHLVLSDAVMPGMGGAEVARRLEIRRPGIKVLFMSGYTDDEVLRRGVVSDAVPFVQKPFTAADLTKAVRDALDS